MTEALPKGFVLHSARISSEIESFGGVDAEDLAKLWRVYTTNRSTLKADEGRRLENLFWRIWSNNAILRAIQGTTLAGLFLHISEGESIARMDRGRLRQISPSIPRIPPRRRAAAPSTAGAEPQKLLPPGTSRKSSLNVSRKPSVSATRAPLPPPILKKPRQPSNDAQRLPGAISTTGASDRVTGSYISLSPSPAAVLEGPLGESASDKPRRKKATFASNITSMEAEPVPNRKKQLSQPPADLSPANHSPTAACARDTRASPGLYGPPTPRRQIYPIIPNESAISISPTPTLTHTPHAKPYPWLGPAVQRPGPGQAGPTSNPTSHPTTSSSTTAAKPAHEQHAQQQKRSNSSPTPQPAQPSKVSLVEKDFRARFVEKRLQESRNSSFTNLGSSLLTLTRAEVKAGGGTSGTGTAAVVQGNRGDAVRLRDGLSSGDAELGRGVGKVKGPAGAGAGGGHSSAQKQQKQHPPRNNGTNATVVDYVHGHDEDEDDGDGDGEWEDIDSDDPAYSISPAQSQSQSQSRSPPQLQPPYQQGAPTSTSRPSIGQQQSQLSEMIERERKVSAPVRRQGNGV
ncbi:hypothetical protein GX51_01814 [Blastomyces parvus]|uniref:Nitrogen regulatory protein areA GATA-like domain-containing protein n=1 Tax=Blastomyces parvus TaxID=2060905 RepID=A0A2B7XED6_9EURO|nr:hypothetical protein GX51_01814 [Blastomyces parvus]